MANKTKDKDKMEEDPKDAAEVSYCDGVREFQEFLGRLMNNSARPRLFKRGSPIRLRPSIVDRACKKSLASSTPLNKNENFTPQDMTDVSVISANNSLNQICNNVFEERSAHSVLTDSVPESNTQTKTPQTNLKKSKNLENIIANISGNKCNTTSKGVQTTLKRKIGRKVFQRITHGRQTQTGRTLDSSDSEASLHGGCERIAIIAKIDDYMRKSIGFNGFMQEDGEPCMLVKTHKAKLLKGAEKSPNKIKKSDENLNFLVQDEDAVNNSSRAVEIDSSSTHSSLDYSERNLFNNGKLARSKHLNNKKTKLNTTSKTVQTSIKKKKEQKKCKSTKKERQTQTGRTLEISNGNVPSPSTNAIDVNAEGTDGASFSANSSHNKCTDDGPWRARSILEQAYLPNVHTKLDLDLDEDGILDDTFRPVPPKKSKVFGNKNKNRTKAKPVKPTSQSKRKSVRSKLSFATSGYQTSKDRKEDNFEKSNQKRHGDCFVNPTIEQATLPPNIHTLDLKEDNVLEDTFRPVPPKKSKDSEKKNQARKKTVKPPSQSKRKNVRKEDNYEKSNQKTDGDCFVNLTVIQHEISDKETVCENTPIFEGTKYPKESNNKSSLSVTKEPIGKSKTKKSRKEAIQINRKLEDQYGDSSENNTPIVGNKPSSEFLIPDVDKIYPQKRKKSKLQNQDVLNTSAKAVQIDSVQEMFPSLSELNQPNKNNKQPNKRRKYQTDTSTKKMTDMVNRKSSLESHSDTNGSTTTQESMTDGAGGIRRSTRTRRPTKTPMTLLLSGNRQRAYNLKGKGGNLKAHASRSTLEPVAEEPILEQASYAFPEESNVGGTLTLGNSTRINKKANETKTKRGRGTTSKESLQNLEHPRKAWSMASGSFEKIHDMDGVYLSFFDDNSYGHLQIDGGKGKSTQVCANHDLCYYVCQGKALVGLKDETCTVKKSDIFVIPHGNEYYINNINKTTKLKLFFTKVLKT